MASSYKTPGVYVEEISKFPPSVSAVETAIPAFIGYTMKANERNGDSLILKPKRITSLLEYENYFGGPLPEIGFLVDVTDAELDGRLERSIKVHLPDATTKRPFLMYYSLQLYFANGGGPCYVTSVALYNPTTGVLKNDLDKGLAAVRKEDEPTLLLFPDATFLSSVNDFYSLYNDALDQCKDLQDRFTILDTYSDSETAIAELRDNTHSEIEYTKYGAAYFPFVETILDYAYDEKQIQIRHVSYEANAIPRIKAAVAELLKPSGIAAKVSSLVETSDADVDGTKDTISGKVIELMSYMSEDINLKDANPANYDVVPVKMTEFGKRLQALQAALNDLITLKKSLKNEAKAAIASLEEPTAGGVRIDIENKLNAFLPDFEGANKIEAIQSTLDTLRIKLNKAKTPDSIKKLLKDAADPNFTAEVEKLLTTNIKNIATFPNNTLIATSIFDNVLANANAFAIALTPAEGLDQNNGELNGRFLGDITNFDNAIYNRIKLEIANLPLVLPPSSAIAGIYARIDNDRGVWKAPANANLNYVIKPKVVVSNEDQEDMNEHSSGKSVNAIRKFAGRGIVVWGARTLAGNDNEWRYINVRRFFIFVEESVKKASERFVFEPNDANTWIKVRAMIENFLALQWRAGALAGATTDQAYYVRVGLGQTMSALDILEGRMIVEIGMAVVRPAEFILLKFSHKMQES